MLSAICRGPITSSYLYVAVRRLSQIAVEGLTRVSTLCPTVSVALAKQARRLLRELRGDCPRGTSGRSPRSGCHLPALPRVHPATTQGHHVKAGRQIAP